MTISESQIDAWLLGKEDEHLEFKEAKNNYQFDKLVKYCAALANEGGGSIVLGVSDKPPRRVVGSVAFQPVERTTAGLVDKLRLRIGVDEIQHRDGRVVVFTAPAHPLGMPIAVDGAYWMRAGEDLVPMTPDQLRRIFDEAGPDYSSEIATGATVNDLDSSAIAEFQRRWSARDGNARIAAWSDVDTLRNAELVDDRGITWAALILFGSRSALGRLLPQAETVFEYRSAESAGPASDRVEFREGFLLYHDRLWDRINLRNDRQSYQDGFFRNEVLTFDEATIREAVLNAVCHRDYRLGGSIFVRQFSRRLEVVNPGGFPAGVTPENVLDQQNPRNRRLAVALGRCGLIDRAGQGVNLMVERSVAQSKPLPDFAGTAAHEVRLTLRGEVTNPAFLRFLEKLSADTFKAFETRDLLVLDLLQRDEPVPDGLRGRLAPLIALGVVESVGRGHGARYFLSRSLYAALGQKGAYTRHRGLDDETNKELLLRHLRDTKEGSPFSELHQVVPALSRRKLKHLLEQLRSEGRAILRNPEKRRWARWVAAPDAGSMDRAAGEMGHKEP